MSKSIFPFSMSAVLPISQKVDHLNNTEPQITTYVYQTCVCAAACVFCFCLANKIFNAFLHSHKKHVAATHNNCLLPWQ